MNSVADMQKNSPFQMKPKGMCKLGCFAKKFHATYKEKSRNPEIWTVMDYVDMAYFLFKNDLAHTTNYDSWFSSVFIIGL